MKNSLYYALIFLILTSMSHQTVAMHGFGKYANGFRLGMKALNYAGTLALPVYLLNQVDIVKKQTKEMANTTATTQASENVSADATVETEKYILSILHTAYPELKNTPIKVVNLPRKNWATYPVNGTYYFATPLTDKDLQTASPDALSKSNVVIRHEGSHILHNDRRNLDVVTLISPAAVLYGLNKMKKTLGLTSLCSKNTVTGNIIKGLGYIPSLPIKIIASLGMWRTFFYWCEYQADQEAIKRTQDPSELRLISSTFANLPPHKPANLKEKIATLLDGHPAPKIRGQYFAEAAQKLEEKQAQEIKKNGANHD